MSYTHANPGMLAVSRLSETGNCYAEEDDRQVSRLEVETTIALRTQPGAHPFHPVLSGRV